MKLQSFAESPDDPDSPFYCAPDKSAGETWSLAHDAMVRLLTDLEQRRPEDLDVSAQTLRNDHMKIFGLIFPADAGRLRWKEGAEWEDGPFGVGVGSGPESAVRAFRGSHPRQIERNLERAFADFHDLRQGLEARSAAEGGVAVREASEAAGRLYARVLRIHPFVDGNLRAAYLTLQASLRKLSLPAVEFPEVDAHNRALLDAFRSDARQTYGSIGELIAGLIPRP